ncbi:MAG: hypothetical protein HQL82_05150 [Magnetococcales bacterium]|nr:hypothetical protein [Magnetococcales bacterium]
MRYQFKAHLTAEGDLYHVEVIVGYKKISVSCDCEAGRMKKPCVHAMGVLRGDRHAFSQGDMDGLQKHLAPTRLGEILARYERETAQLEKQMRELRDALQKRHTEMEKFLRDGFPTD